MAFPGTPVHESGKIAQQTNTCVILDGQKELHVRFMRLLSDTGLAGGRHPGVLSG
jgi:hypothetical protein